jgi:glycosyltransferase involved in cell wall biosynthesis
VSTLPTCSVITPTWFRHDLLLDRCIPSVREQDYPGLVEHVIVSDGPDPVLVPKLVSAAPWNLETICLDGEPEAARPVRTQVADQLPEHGQDLHWGAAARQHGAKLATGELICYLDDDDSFRPGHVRLLTEALIASPGSRWAYSRMVSHQAAGEAVIGLGPLACGGIGTPMIMHRADLLDVAGWDVSSSVEDWEIVSRWLAAGVAYCVVDAETVDVYPSAFWHGR